MGKKKKQSNRRTLRFDLSHPEHHALNFTLEEEDKPVSTLTYQQRRAIRSVAKQPLNHTGSVKAGHSTQNYFFFKSQFVLLIDKH